MSNYYPDKWVILKITTPTDVLYKCLCGWYGGFAKGDSWRLNSGIDHVIDVGDSYQIYGYSGSMYDCMKSGQGLSSYTENMYNSFVQHVKELSDGHSIEILNTETDDFKGLIKND